MARTDPAAIDQLIERILDAAPADWSSLDAARVDNEHELEALRTLADIAQAFRRFDAPAASTQAPSLFRWGHLDVLAKVADGGSSEVYRAWDAGLGLPVALKLLKRAADAPRASGFLDEARRLAKVRHRNVLSVYGAATHGGRPGLWCEWIDGESLARRIAEDGPLGPEEATVIGLALCRALDAVHAAGLLHGDVKPANVLRERGGRIVLVDLGAGGAPEVVNASLRSAASPAWLAPEVLRGALRTPQQDLYALGGVLQFLLSGQAPDPTQPGVGLERRDVPPALHAVIARARAADPVARFSTTHAMADALKASLGHADIGPTPRARRRWLAALATAALAAIAWAAITLRPTALPTPVDIELRRNADGGAQTLVDGSRVMLGDRLSLRVQTQAPTWLYVYNEDDHGALQRLFPLPELDTHNPLPAGRRNEIPGRWHGRTMHFEVSSNAQAEEFLVVAAAAPIALLDALAADPAFASAELRTRGTALVVPAGDIAAGTRLTQLADTLAALPTPPQLLHYRLPHHTQPQP